MQNLAPARRAHSRLRPLSDHEALTNLVITALWDAFPECDNEPEIAEAAAPYFRDRLGKPVSTRTIRYWLRGETLPGALHLTTLMLMQPAHFARLLGRAA